MDLDFRSNKAVVAIALTFLVVSAAVLGVLALDRPRVTAVDNDWGTVTQDRTEIETQVVIKNPRLLEVSETVVNVEYTVALNTVEIAHGRKNTVQLSGKQNVITVSTWVNNDDIPEWWVTHINRNQTTTVRVDPTVAIKYAGVTLPVPSWTRTRTVKTNMLEPLQTNETRWFRSFGQTLLAVNKTNAHWGRAGIEQTPLIVSATVTNRLPNSIPITNIGYTIRMNGVRIGDGVTNQREVIPPNSTRTIETRAILDNSRLDEWWVTHLRRNETTELTVNFYATIEYGGERRRVPLDFLTYQRTFHTQIFEANESVKSSDRDVDLLPVETVVDGGALKSYLLIIS